MEEEQGTPPTPDRDPRVRDLLEAYWQSDEFRDLIHRQAMQYAMLYGAGMVTVDAYRRVLVSPDDPVFDGRADGRRLHDAMIGALEGRDAVTEGAPIGATDALTTGDIRRAARALEEASVYPSLPPLTMASAGGEVRPLVGPPISDDVRRLVDIMRGHAEAQVHWAPAPPADPVDEEARRIRREAQLRRQEQELARAEAARVRAEGLLLERLTPEQRATWTDRRYVEVRGSRSGRTYRIKRGVSMNVECPEAGLTYCAAPANAHETPTEDVVLAQVLWLACDEDGFLAAANRAPYFAPAMMMDPGWDRFWAYEGPAGGAVPPHLRDALGRAAPRPRGADPGPRRAGVEAWVPDCCAGRGCELRLDRVDNGFGSGFRVRHPEIDPSGGRRDISVVIPSDRARAWSSREIRRHLEGPLGRLHRDAPAPG
jgi:hypothetical protein